MSFIILFKFFEFEQTFPSPQVKEWEIVTDKHGIYE